METARRIGLAVAVLLATGLLMPSAVTARCRTTSELLRLGAAVRSELWCHAGSTADGASGSCREVVPACGVAAAAALRELALGAASESSPRWDPSSANGLCAAAIVRALGSFASHRLRERALRRRRTGGGGVLRWAARVCNEGRLSIGRATAAPPLGGACAALRPAGGGAIVTGALEHCLRASVERIVDDVAPVALRPNIVLIVTDDQRWDTLGFMPTTFERLAGRGFAFRNAFATTPSCSPSRASIYSGRLARNHGVIENGDEAAFDPTATIATVLSEAGYATGFFGKYLNDAEQFGPSVPPGWDEWNVFLEPAGGSYFASRMNDNGTFRMLRDGEYSTDVLAERALQFVRRNLSRPFLLVYAPFAPHDPSLPAPRHQGRFSDLPPYRPPSWHEADLSDKPVWVRFFAHIIGPAGTRARDLQRIRELETLLAVDEAVLAIDKLLERAGLGDQTLVAFTSDHGIHWGEHWTGTKFSAYEESIRVPLLLRYPGRFPVARQADALVANVDLAPTFAALAGTAFPHEVDGRNLIPLMDAVAAGASTPWRQEVPIESRGGLITAGSRALRTARWKYIAVDARIGIREELYDLVADPYEMQNLAFDPGYAATRRELATRLEEVLPSGLAGTKSRGLTRRRSSPTGRGS